MLVSRIYSEGKSFYFPNGEIKNIQELPSEVASLIVSDKQDFASTNDVIWTAGIFLIKVTGKIKSTRWVVLHKPKKELLAAVLLLKD